MCMLQSGPENLAQNLILLNGKTETFIGAIKHAEDTPTNKGCRRAARETHERDQITNEIV